MTVDDLSYDYFPTLQAGYYELHKAEIEAANRLQDFQRAETQRILERVKPMTNPKDEI